MTLSNSIFAVSGAATFLDARKDMSNLFACDTSLEPHPGLLTVGGSSAANGNVVVGMSNRMAVTVRPFQAVLNRLGALLIMNDGDVVVSLQAAPSANSRIDVVYVKQREKRAPISDSEDGPIIGVVTGTANLTPTAPQVPDGAVALAQVKVPSGVTNTTAGGVVITQVYPFAATRGEELRFRTKGDMDAFAAADGTKATTVSDNAHYVRYSGKWINRTLTYSRSGLSTASDELSIGGSFVYRNGGLFLLLTCRWVNKGQFTSSSWSKTPLCKITNPVTITREVSQVMMENIAYEHIGKNCLSAFGKQIAYQTPGTIPIGANTWHNASLIAPVDVD